MHGKALFFKTISVQQNEIRSNFQRVPDNLTLAQAAEELQKQCTAPATASETEQWREPFDRSHSSLRATEALLSPEGGQSDPRPKNNSACEGWLFATVRGET